MNSASDKSYIATPFVIAISLYSISVVIFPVRIWLANDLGNNCTMVRDVNALFDTSQIAILALVIALAVYTSSITVKLRETMAKLPEKSRKPHLEDLYWNKGADLILVVTGIVVVLRLGYRYGVNDADPAMLALWAHAIIGGLITIVLYFAWMHCRQWCVPKAKVAPPIPQFTMDTVLRILDALNANAMLVSTHYPYVRATLETAAKDASSLEDIKVRLKAAHDVGNKL